MVLYFKSYHVKLLHDYYYYFNIINLILKTFHQYNHTKKIILMLNFEIKYQFNFFTKLNLLILYNIRYSKYKTVCTKFTNLTIIQIRMMSMWYIFNIKYIHLYKIFINYLKQLNIINIYNYKIIFFYIIVYFY